MLDSQVVSGDSHLEIPPTDWQPYVPAKYQEYVPLVVTFEGNEAIQIPGNVPIFSGTNLGTTLPIVMRGNSYWDENGTPVPGAGAAAQRLREQDADNISAELLYAPLFMGRCIEGVRDHDGYLAMVAAYNTFLADYCSHDSDRLFGVGVLPNSGVENCIKELQHISSLGLPAVCPRWFPAGVGMPAPDDDLFWAECLNLGVKITPHSMLGGMPNKPQHLTPGPFIAPEPPAPFGLAARATSGIPQVLSFLLISGVFDRIPDVKFYFGEVNAGWLPHALSMLDDSYVLLRHSYDLEFKMLPSEYILQHCLFGIIRDPVALDMVSCGMLPASNIIWGSDFPHSVTSWPNSQSWLAKANLTDGDCQMITRTNILDFLEVT